MYRTPRLSPDGGRLAVTVQGEKNDVWIYEFARTTLTPLTSEGRTLPVWTPDGKRVAFGSASATSFSGIFWKSADGSGAEEQLPAIDHTNVSPLSWSPDGKSLAFGAYDVAKETSEDFTHNDIWWVSLEEPRAPHPFVQTRFREGGAVFSPDGRWLAYVSDESGRDEVHVRAFPGPGAKWQISSDGGIESAWPRDGHEIFYRRGDAMMAVDVKRQPLLRRERLDGSSRRTTREAMRAGPTTT
jgi:Tol biopolymer transport system component